jgi:hypothetical protein
MAFRYSEGDEVVFSYVGLGRLRAGKVTKVDRVKKEFGVVLYGKWIYWFKDGVRGFQFRRDEPFGEEVVMFEDVEDVKRLSRDKFYKESFDDRCGDIELADEALNLVDELVTPAMDDGLDYWGQPRAVFVEVDDAEMEED